MNTFLSEFEAYRLLKEADLHPPRFGLLDQDVPFESGEPIVLKGLGEELWHTSDLDCVRFLPFEPQALEGAAQAMRDRVEGEGLHWLGALVCERIRIRKAEGHPAEALASLVRVDGEWMALMGYGGLQAEALAELAPPRMEGGPLAFLSQSGAFLLCRRSQQDLSMGFGIALGNQMDAGLPELLEALAEDPDLQAFAAYVEGFKPGGLAATARAAARLRTLGKTLLVYRAGRTEAGRSAAATHTGALAGEGRLETELLRQAGARLAPSQVAFDAALGWLGVYPRPRSGPVALLTNAGFEAVTAGDLLEAPFRPAELTERERRRLADLLRSHNLEGLVAPRLPLDLTPMADAKAYLQAAELLLESEAAILVVSLVPFTRRLPSELGQVEALGRTLGDLARASGKAVALAVDAGADHGPYREALGRGGLPVFTRVEKALMGLVALA